MNLFLYWLWIMFAFVCGMGLMAILKRQPDDECKSCDLAYKDTIRRLEEQIHGLQSSKGKLGKELQNMAFGRYGTKAR